MLSHRLAAQSLVCLVSLWAFAAQAQPLVEEVPFITTPDNVTLEMLRIADVGPQDFVVDLGSGDGRIVITAAKTFGARGLGVEIVGDLVRRSNTNAQRAGVAGRVEFREQDIFATPLANATVVTMYLLPEYNLKLRPSLLALAPGTRIVSHDWDMGEWESDRAVTVSVPDKTVGMEKSSRVMMWRVPARVDGLWCAGPARLRIAQTFQVARLRLEGVGPDPAVWATRIDGARIPAPADSPEKPAMQWRGGELLVDAAASGLAASTRFVRAVENRCP